MTMTPDQCFDEMAVALGVPKDTGYIDLLELVKKLKEDKMKFAEKVMEQLVEGIKPQMDELKMKFAEKVVVEQIKPQMDKLKEENKELEEELETCRKVRFSVSEMCQELREEKKKLKEEILEWKKRAAGINIVSRLVNKEEENEKLKEENKKLKKYQTMIYCVWSDLYWADKSGCEVSFKDVANSCDYYDNEEFVKQEVVEDEDED